MANEITVASPPTTEEAALLLLASIAAQSGIATDYNVGSQIRTLAESIGSTVEIAGVSALTLALQTIAYSGMSIFGITPNQAVPAVGSVTFATAFVVNAPPAVQNISIPFGTLVQTLGGIQFQTAASGTLVIGATGVALPIVAVNGGFNTNVPPGSINQLLSGLIYPLQVSNSAATSGGLDAENSTQALSRLAAKLTSLVGGSPVSVANSAIGVMASGSSETVVYSTCYEGWLDPASPNFPITPGFTLYIDNGSGNASAALISAVNKKLNGNIITNTPAFRPSGMPYSIAPVVPLGAVVTVAGTTVGAASPVTGAIAQAVNSYFTLPFGQAADQPQIAAAVANAALGQLSSLSVTLAYASNPSVSVMMVSGAAYTRVLLFALNITITPT